MRFNEKNKKNHLLNIGFIYFMTERDLFGYPCGPYVKIGLVKGNDDGRSSFERRNEHQTGNPREIIVEAEVETYAQVSTLESLVHQRLARYRIHGEWFNYGEDGIQPYVELTKKINEELESQINDNLLINQYALIEDNGEELKPSSDAKDIHNELLDAKKEIIKIKNEKDLAKLKLRSFDKSFYRDIEGICFYEKIKPQEKFDKVNFEKDHPDIFEELSVEVITPNFNIKKDLKNKKSEEVQKLEEIKVTDENIREKENGVDKTQTQKSELELLEERDENSLTEEEEDRMYELRRLRAQKRINDEVREDEQAEFKKADEEIAHLKTLLKPKKKKLPKGYVE